MIWYIQNKVCFTKAASEIKLNYVCDGQREEASVPSVTLSQLSREVSHCSIVILCIQTAATNANRLFVQDSSRYYSPQRQSLEFVQTHICVFRWVTDAHFSQFQTPQKCLTTYFNLFQQTQFYYIYWYVDFIILIQIYGNFFFFFFLDVKKWDAAGPVLEIERQ